MARKPLGRGLDALLSADSKLDELSSGLAAISIVEIQRGSHQPRRRFDAASLAELVESIKSQGMMQPVVVRPRAGGGYELIAGERRMRAAGLAGFDSVPALIQDVSDEQALIMALIENVQRENLRPLEEAEALVRLREEFGMTQQAVADSVSKSREAVANLMRLLNLHSTVRQMLDEGALEMGHARALLSLPSAAQVVAGREVVARKLNVRQTETLVRGLLAVAAAETGPTRAKDANVLDLERTLSEKICASVSISHTAKGAGKLTIRYASLDELDGILSRIR